VNDERRNEPQSSTPINTSASAGDWSTSDLKRRWNACRVVSAHTHNRSLSICPTRSHTASCT
jgi:hypothetical protein